MRPKARFFGLGVHMVYAIMDQAAEKSGLAATFAAQGLKLSPHSLRNTFATHCYLGGMSSGSLSALLGHGKMLTLLKYVECTPEHRQLEYDRAHA